MELGKRKKLGGFWPRLIAAVIDIIIISCIITLPMMLLRAALLGEKTTSSQLEAIIILSVIFVVPSVLALLYSPLMMMRKGAHNGQTVGKQVMNIKVVSEKSVPLTFKMACRREILGKGPLWLTFFLIPLFMILVLVFYGWPYIKRSSRRSLHDVIGKTYVLSSGSL